MRRHIPRIRKSKKLTDQPVKYVALERVQRHTMPGSSYWQEQGAMVIAHANTAAEIAAFGETALAWMVSKRMDKSLLT